MISRLIFLLAALLVTGTVRADDAVKLAGSAISSADAEARCNTIFVGQAINATGKVRISQMLEAPCHCQYAMETNVAVNPGPGEAGPQVGKSYIFFTHSPNKMLHDSYNVDKILPATDETIAEVRKLISN